MNVKELFDILMENLKLPTLKSNGGDWDKEFFMLDHNSYYGGYRIEQISKKEYRYGVYVYSGNDAALLNELQEEKT